MERLERSVKRTKTIICIFVYIMYSLESCNNHANSNPSFVDVFEAYKWLGYAQEDKRTHKIMEFLHNYDAKSMKTGVVSIPFSEYTGIYNYAVCCTNADFKNLNFIPLSKKHRGIAYIREVDEYNEGVMNDTIKIYFPDSLRAKAFVEEAIKAGFHRYGAFNLDDIPFDSIYRIKTQFAASYRDTINNYVYFVRVLSETDKNVVILNCCP